MALCTKLLPFLFLITLIIHSANIKGTTAQTPDLITYYCTNNNANYTMNSTYQANLNTLLPSLPSATANNYGFSNTSVGRDPDTVNALALCRGDLSQERCSSCVSNATIKLRQVCPNQKEAVGWYEICMLRYSDKNIFHIKDEGFIRMWYNYYNATSVTEFNRAFRNLSDRLRSEAVNGGSLRKYATGNITGPDFLTIYGLMQCTPDLSSLDCGQCLDGLTRRIPGCCNGALGLEFFVPSCKIKFEVGEFYDEIPADPLPSPPAPPPAPDSISAPALLPPSPSPRGKSNNTTRIIIFVAIPTASCVVLVALIYIFVRMRKITQRSPLEKFQNGDDISTIESLQYSFSTLSIATDDFSENNKLGEGGFGPVYKGRLQNGLEIAVKRLARNSGQGEVEFKNEVLLVSKLQHRNLVRMLGFCLEGPERLLIYEFLPYASLDRFIFDQAKRALLDWDRRYKIIGGVAKGLLYLHEDSRLRIIHRDLKASNVLLDSEMNAKIADFGTARLFKPEESQANTSRIVGTYGYMSPEYAMHGLFSVKSDVFSFGVLLLETVTGQKNQYFRNENNTEDLLTYAWKSWKKGTVQSMIDSKLRQNSSGSMRDIMRSIHIGLLCVQENVDDRPTMGSIILMLSSLSITLNTPSEPAFYMHSTVSPEMPLLEEELTSDSNQSNARQGSSHWTSENEVSITELYPR